ncbi:hypothetical protein LTS12_028882 [Elasticomyces elasticus]|nr:hypothetical protein LTS12_028882 [Elasticomyces elasticus]
MTSRIQEDGSATESKWADIDDDEDDWAPETIEWTDGTKTNLAEPPTPVPQPASLPTLQPEHRPTVQPEQQLYQDIKFHGEQPREPLLQMEPPPAVKDASRFAPRPTSIGPNATVLRLGANAEKQAKYAGISSRGPNDKQPFSSSSNAPPPSKSPWAPLPPVEKASPGPPKAQLQQQPSPRHFNRDFQMGESFPGGPAPSSFPPGGPPHPKEIAADDFNHPDATSLFPSSPEKVPCETSKLTVAHPSCKGRSQESKEDLQSRQRRFKLIGLVVKMLVDLGHAAVLHLISVEEAVALRVACPLAALTQCSTPLMVDESHK